MRKNGWIMVILVVFGLGLVGCGPTVLDGAVSVNSLFSSMVNKDMNVLKVIEYHPDYLVVELNGEKHNIVPNSVGGTGLVHIGFFGFNDTPNFLTWDLFDVKTWDFGKDDNPNLEYFVFLNGHNDREALPLSLHKTDYLTQDIELVLFYKSQMPSLVGAEKWNGSQATVVSWKYPAMSPQIIQNMNTREFAFVEDARVVDKTDTRYYFNRDSASYGYLTAFFPGNGFPILYISEIPLKY